MLYLLTGSPGSGKSLSAVDWILRVKEETPDRIIYAANITGLDIPGVINLDDDGVLAWHEACEKNSIIFVDEAQRYWRAQRSGEPSKAIIEMETHRHDGIDIVMMTQHPTFVHSNIRKLINIHVHLCAYTKQSALRWEWRECHDDVQEKGLREAGEFKEWQYPARCYGLYTSATQHTKIIKRPLRQTLARIALGFAAVVFVALFGFIGWKIYDYAHSSNAKADASKRPAPGTPSTPAAQGQGQAQQAPRFATTKDFVAAQIPRVAAQPYSAPIYDGQAVTQHPQVFCIRVEASEDCSCITEQGTRYEVNNAMCRKLAMDGPPYDPFKPEKRQEQPVQAQQGSPSGQPASVMVADATGVQYAPKRRADGIPQEYEPPTYGKWNPEPLASHGSR